MEYWKVYMINIWAGKANWKLDLHTCFRTWLKCLLVGKTSLVLWPLAEGLAAITLWFCLPLMPYFSEVHTMITCVDLSGSDAWVCEFFQNWVIVEPSTVLLLCQSTNSFWATTVYRVSNVSGHSLKQKTLSLFLRIV